MKNKFKRILWLGITGATIAPLAIVACSTNNKKVNIKKTFREYLSPFPDFQGLSKENQDNLVNLTDKLSKNLISYYKENKTIIAEQQANGGQKIGKLPDQDKVNSLANEIGLYIYELQMNLQLPPQSNKEVYNKVISLIAKESPSKEIEDLIKDNPF